MPQGDMTGIGLSGAGRRAAAVLMKGNLVDVPTAMSFSRATLTNIRQNLFWAFSATLSAFRWRPGFSIRSSAGNWALCSLPQR